MLNDVLVHFLLVAINCSNGNAAAVVVVYERVRVVQKNSVYIQQIMHLGNEYNIGMNAASTYWEIVYLFRRNGTQNGYHVDYACVFQTNLVIFSLGLMIDTKFSISVHGYH